MLPQSLINLVYLAVFAVIFAVPLSAQEPALPTFDSPDVTIEWQFGLAGRIYGSDREDLRRDFANHVSFLITNHRDTIMEGVIDVGILSEHTPITNLTHESVAIGPGSTKRFSFSLSDSPFWGSWNSPSFTAQPGAGVEASFKEAQSNRLLWQRSELYVVEEMRYASQLRCLVIGNPRRVPVHSPPLLPRLPQGSQQGNALALGERSLEFQQISPWQAPDSFPCLAPFNAVVLSPDIEPDAFTAAQQRALAEYVVNSGVLVLPTETADGWREAIFSNNKRLPFSLKETADGDLFLYGNGKVSTLRMPAVGTQDAVSARQLYDLIDGHHEPPLAMKLDRQFRSSQLGTHATESAMIVAGFLGLYGVISVGALYFFRRMRRLALIRAVMVMIALFSTGSVVMGLYLRTLPGDVEWSTLTEACPGGGAIQHGNFHFVSAGNRDQEFEVTPAETLIQPDRPFYNDWYDGGDYIWRREGLRLYPNDAYGAANISILPWGHAYWNSRLYITAIQPLTASVQLTDDKKLGAAITVTNPNDFPVNRAALYLHISSGAVESILGTNPNQKSRRFRESLRAVQLGSIPPKRTISVNGSFDSGDRFSSSMFHPTSPLRGQIAGYIVGYLSSSPGVEPTPGKGFDQDSDSFLDDSRHGFFQRLPTAGLPTDQELIDQLIPYLNLDATPNPISESGGFIQVQ